MKKYILLLILLLCSYGYFFQKSESFNSPRWDCSISQENLLQINKILKQPFFYLGSGSQCEAYESQDGTCVIKFLRQKRLQLPFLYALLPSCSLKAKKQAARKARQEKLFKSLKIGFVDIPEESGMLYLHLNTTERLHPEVTLHDKEGKQFISAVDGSQFLLQKKALPIKETIDSLMQQGQIAAAKERINQIFALLSSCAKKGVKDNDHALISRGNLGFLQERAIYIDTGKLVKKSPSKIHSQHLKTRLEPLHRWLQKYPELADHIDQLLSHS